MNISNLLQRIRRHLLGISLLVYIVYFAYLLTILEGPMFFIAATFIFSIDSIPLFFIGIFVTKHDSPTVGLSYCLSYLTVEIASEFLGKSPLLFGISNEILVVFPIGVFFTWIGSVIGDRIRHIFHVEHLKLDLKKGFLVAYIFYIIFFGRLML